MNLRLDRLTGELKVGSPPCIFRRELALNEFLGSALGRTSRKVRSSREFYAAWIPFANDLRLGVVLCFGQDSALERLNLKIVPQTLEAWSKAVEDEMKARHDHWLASELGPPPYQFPWGRVISVIDQHGYSAVVRVIYRER